MTTLILVLAVRTPSNGGTKLFPLWLSIPVFVIILSFVLYRKFGSRRK